MDALRQDSAYLHRLLEAAPVVLGLIDQNATIQWMNGSIEGLFGYTAEEVVGKNILDFLEVDWDPIALESIATAMAADGARLPMLFRAIRKDGTPVVVEVIANVQFNDPVIGGLVCSIRRWDERNLIDDALEAMAASAPIATTFRILLNIAESETLEARAAIRYQPDDFSPRQVLCSEGLDPSLSGDVDRLDGELAVTWADLLSTPTGTVHNTTELPPCLADRAADAGFKSLWIWPSAAQLSAPARITVAAWRTGSHDDADQSRRQMMDRLARVGGLVLDRDRSAAGLAHAATHDSLTGLANRVLFYSKLGAALRGASLPPTTGGAEPEIGVIYFDLDRFKPVNDQLGHGVGDELLKEIARRLLLVVEPADLPARIGGDEFAILRAPTHGIEGLEELARRLIETLSAPFAVDEHHEVAIGVSIGIAIDEVGACEPDELVDAADTALYHVKADGGSGYKVAPRPSSTGEFRRPVLN